MTKVTLQHLTKTYAGSETPAIDDLSLEVEHGELIALLGPSGCGKTTTMKMIAGLLDPTDGEILFDDNSILKEKPEHRGAVMVFQNHLLFPYLSVFENIGFGLKMRRIEKTEISKRVDEMLELVKLPGLGNRKPSELSGGQQQRVALARALIVQPKVLLLDEPLSNLDAHLRFEMRDLIRNLQRDMKITTIFVTHDQEEAVVLADRIALILDGELKQYDTPHTIYRQPADSASAQFFGNQNIIRGLVKKNTFICSFGQLKLDGKQRVDASLVTIRPEDIKRATRGDKENSFDATLASKIYMGTQTRLVLALNDTLLEMIANPNDVEDLAEGMKMRINLPSSALWSMSS